MDNRVKNILYNHSSKKEINFRSIGRGQVSDKLRYNKYTLNIMFQYYNYLEKKMKNYLINILLLKSL